MIPESELVQIVERLVEKTERGEVAWEASRDDARREAKEIFMVKHQGIDLLIAYYEPPVGNNEFTFSVFENLEKVGSLHAEESSSIGRVLSRLHEQANRVAYGWDDTLRRINNLLSGDRVLGTSPSQRQAEAVESAAS